MKNQLLRMHILQSWPRMTRIASWLTLELEILKPSLVVYMRRGVFSMITRFNSAFLTRAFVMVLAQFCMNIWDSLDPGLDAVCDSTVAFLSASTSQVGTCVETLSQNIFSDRSVPQTSSVISSFRN